MKTSSHKKNGSPETHKVVVTAAHHPEAYAAFQRVEPKLATVTEPARVIVDIPNAALTVLGAVPRVQAMRALIAKQLPDFDLNNVDQLPDYALAAVYTHVTATDAPSGPVQTLIGEAVPLRQKLLAAASAHAAYGDFEQQQVDDIKAGTGYLDTASDCIALGGIFKEAWPRIKGRTLVTEEEVDRACEVGTQLFQALVTGGAVSGVMAERRVRAYTLMVGAYDECRRAIGFLRWHEGDVDTIVPSLYTKPRKSTKEAAEPAAPPAPPPAPDASDVNDGTGEPTPIAAPAPVVTPAPAIPTEPQPAPV